MENIIKKRQTSNVLLVLLILIGLVGGYIYYSQIASSDTEAIPPMPEDTLSVFKEIILDFEIFNRIDFKNLKIIGESPVRPDPGGKTDLFAP